jgi:hypothetical protein
MTLDPPSCEAVGALGYTPREAAFLALVARHSGYFVRRQFLQWIGRQHGQTIVEFTQKLLARRHATVQTFCYATHVYHLSASVLYAAATAPISHQRRRVPEGVKARLMALDCVFARPTLHFLTSDEARLAYCDTLGIDRAWLPQRRYCGYRATAGTLQYFVEAAPMGLLHDSGSVPTLVCAFIDDGTASVGGFETHLRDYRRLWVSVPRWRLVYIADTPRRLPDAEAAFRRVCAEPVGLPFGANRVDLPSLLDYFRLRGAYDAKRWASLDKAALDRFRDLRRRFAGHDWEVLYGQWESRGEDAIRRVLSVPAPAATLNPSAFQPCVLGLSYVATNALGRSA